MLNDKEEEPRETRRRRRRRIKCTISLRDSPGSRRVKKSEKKPEVPLAFINIEREIGTPQELSSRGLIM
jgi:hypothetical protein